MSLERRLSALEKSVDNLRIVTNGTALEWTPPTEKRDHSSSLSEEAQMRELEKQWDGCQIVGDSGIEVSGSMAEGWAITA